MPKNLTATYRMPILASKIFRTRKTHNRKPNNPIITIGKIAKSVIFFGYMASTLLSYGWLVDWQKQSVDVWLPFAFVVSAILFLLMGLYAIKDISQTMKKEFEELKKLRKPKSGTEEKPK